jgi:ribonuclease HI
VYNGELEVVTQVVEYASSNAKEGDIFIVFSDNQAALLRLKTPSDNPEQSQQIRAILASKTITSLKASITLAWVPGHSDIVGKQRADKLAKATTKSPADSNNTSFAYLGVIISNQKRN